MELYVPDEATLLALANSLAVDSAPIRVIYLDGELGAGKTTWARGYLGGLGVASRVKSPTFTVIETYPSQWGPICHFDLYRLVDPEELEYVGIRDLDAQAACLIFEWPDQGRGHLPAPDLTIEFSYADRGRRLRFSCREPAAMAEIRSRLESYIL
jgi:tRNA threonylcarbamoyladenosine biosynthesis protein TsaE